MDKEELDKIKEQSDEVIRGVVALQDEIKKYKSGAESFELAVGVLAQVAEKEKEVATEMKNLVREMSKSNLRKIIEDTKNIDKEIEKRFAAQQKEEKKLEREIKEMRAEMKEVKELLEKNKEKRVGIRKLFGKR